MTGARHPATVRSTVAAAYRMNGRFFLTRVNLFLGPPAVAEVTVH
jgi:hypothetical protein